MICDISQITDYSDNISISEIKNVQKAFIKLFFYDCNILNKELVVQIYLRRRIEL